MRKIKKIIKSITPVFAIRLYHLALSYFGALLYGFPGKKMVIIGVLGTRGKTTTSNLIWSILTAGGYKTGLTGTANIRIGNEEKMNPYHMTMPGRFKMQKMLREMYDAGCKFTIVETPSEGVEQFRHRQIAYDILVFTNLYPEYLETHNWSFERCKEMHKKPFAELWGQKRKMFDGEKVPKAIVMNADLPEKNIFLNHKADQKITFGVIQNADFKAEKISATPEGVSFSVNGKDYALHLLGLFNVPNALGAISVSSVFRIPYEAVKKGILSCRVPGRMERIENEKGISVFVDYAHDSVSLKAVLETANASKTKDSKVIVLTGGQGGGRDIKKRPEMGRIAGELADYVVITNEDPYDENPMHIIEDIAKGCELSGKKRGVDFFVVPERKDGIQKAISLAKRGDIILITGKGAEQSMETAKGQIPWDDRKITREILKN